MRYTMLRVIFFPFLVLKSVSPFSHRRSFLPLHCSCATFSNIFLIIGARLGSRNTFLSPLSAYLSWMYPRGGGPGRHPCSHLARNPLFTLMPLLSFSSFACEHRIISKNFSFGLLVNLCPCVRISRSF